MNQSSDDSSTMTIRLIDQFVFSDKKLSEIIERRSILLRDVIEYVRTINPSLFSWEVFTDAYLRERKLGSVKIEFDKEQPLFSAGNEFIAKRFPELLSTLTLDVTAKRHFSLKARICFWPTRGRFVWESGRETLFLSERQLATDNRKFGDLDIFDCFSIFGDGAVYVNGQYHMPPHPVDAINEELRMMFLDHLTASNRD